VAHIAVLGAEVAACAVVGVATPAVLLLFAMVAAIARPRVAGATVVCGVAVVVLSAITVPVRIAAAFVAALAVDAVARPAAAFAAVVCVVAPFVVVVVFVIWQRFALSPVTAFAAKVIGSPAIVVWRHVPVRGTELRSRWRT
jgi:hypothetical protein